MSGRIETVDGPDDAPSSIGPVLTPRRSIGDRAKSVLKAFTTR